ncbi:MAG: 3-dehydroquinate synthase [Acholeplasmatales bacterium]|nr:3-dehydroquinate synthase [Acholeplasmatales bacterium]
MKIIDMNLKNNPYKVYIESGILDKACDYISSIYNKKNIYIITDNHVANIYLDRLIKILSAKYIVKSVIVPEGESSKSFNEYVNVLTKLLDLNMRRNEMLVALGGGVIGDLTGFVASTIYRGCPYVQIPTSLLAQMDSSIGGKTGIDFAERKNIIGAFKQPSLVLIDPYVLDSLENRQFSNGMAELIKHGIIGNASLFNKLLRKPCIDEDIISESLSVKQDAVLKDEFDNGERMRLNFGHTFGHVVELEKNLLHGEAVALGMLMALRFGEDLGITPKDIYPQVKSILESYNLPVEEIDYKKYLLKTLGDKKNLAGTVNFILIDKLGSSVIYPLTEDKIKEIINGR